MKRLKKQPHIYAASNVTYNTQTGDAHSYGWWRFVATIHGKVIFNNFRYSNTTARHQYKVRKLLQERGVQIDIKAPFSGGIERELQMLTPEKFFQHCEELICDDFLGAEAKKISKAERAKIVRDAVKAVRNAKIAAGPCVTNNLVDTRTGDQCTPVID